MKNKIISLIIFLSIIWFFVFIYYYFLVLNKATIVIKANTTNYKVYLKNKKLDITFQTNCQKEICTLIEIAPLEYELKIEKENYKTYTSDIKVPYKSTLEIPIKLKKEFYIEKISPKENDSTKEEISEEEKQKNALIEEKIKQIRERNTISKQVYKSYNIDEKWFFYLVKNKENLDIYYKKTDEKIYSILKTDINNFEIKNVFNEENYIYIKTKDTKIIYDLLSWKTYDFFFPQDINYIKKTKNIIFLVNDKWTFICDLDTKKVEYFYLFKDFIVLDEENYLWVIFDEEKDKKKNYNISSEKDLIIKYNSKTKNLSILKESPIKISKIISKSWEYYFYDIQDNIFKINNF